MTSKRIYIYIVMTLAIIGYKFFYYDRLESIPIECLEYEAYHKEMQIKIDHKKFDSIAELFNSLSILKSESEAVSQAVKHLRKQPDKLRSVCIQAINHISTVL